MARQRILSGIQPTGDLHLGNYLGALRNWVDLQKDYDCFLFMADLHAITVPHDPTVLAENTYKTAAIYLAAGIDVDTVSTIFVQSHVSAHSELGWLLTCVTPLNWLQDMVQFKEKAIRQGEKVGAGLLCYPALQAADILLYEPDKVPVGEDQKQHLELTRDITIRINDQFGTSDHPVLKMPEPMIRKEGARIMSLTDGTKKMSKSDPSDLSRINLLDPPELIQKKVKKCKTDPARGLEFDNPDRPECQNLLSLYMLMSNQTQAAVAAECREMGWGQFKPLLAEAIVEGLRPIQERYHAIRADEGYLELVLKRGGEKANGIAHETLIKVRKAMGYTIPS
ncbi:MAG: tryptophan--tRNA ligase [Leptolyngbyaceae bacterium]|nr:tryptophan--tRNA ligase [Leptolyngbyaceae bacterium]